MKVPLKQLVEELKIAFTKFAPKTNFMDNFVGAEQAQVRHIFEQLHLPLPNSGSFLPGT